MIVKIPIQKLGLTPHYQLFEGLLHRKPYFQGEEWDYLIQNRLEDVTDAGKMLCCLARVPAIADRRQRAVTNGEVDAFTDLHNEAAAIYDTSVTISQNLQGLYLDAASKAVGSSAPRDQSDFAPCDWIMYANFQRLYGLSLFTTCFLNCLLRSFSSEQANLDLREEVAQYTTEIIILAEQSEVFRPLGSSYLVLCLFIAWVSGPDNKTRARLNELWKISHSDIPSIRSTISDLESVPLGYTLVDIMDGISTKWKMVACVDTETDEADRTPFSDA